MTSATIFSIVIESSLKGLIVMILCYLILKKFRYSSATCRHQVLVLTVISLFLLPFLSTCLPRLEVFPPFQKYNSVSANPNEDSIVRAKIFAVENAEIKQSQVDAQQIRGSQVTSDASMVPNVQLWLLAIWALGSLLLITRHTIGIAKVYKFKRTTLTRANKNVDEQVLNCCRDLSIKRHVALRYSKEEISPVTIGTLRPTILLPREFVRWTKGQQRTVLLHELTHIKRFDYAINLLSMILCALFWINPLMFILARRLVVEQEISCDDKVLTSGIKSKEYAQQIFTMANSLHPAFYRSGAYVALISMMDLEQRILSILASGKNRKEVDSKHTALAIILSLLIIVPLSAMTFQSDASRLIRISDFPENAWIYIQDGNQFIIPDGYRLSIEGVGQLQKEWKGKRIKFQKCRVLAENHEPVNCYLKEDITEITLQESPSGVIWTISLDKERKSIRLSQNKNLQLELINWDQSSSRRHQKGHVGKTASSAPDIFIEIEDRELLMESNQRITLALRGSSALPFSKSVQQE